MNDVARILSAIEQGDPKAAGELLPLVYGELRRLSKQRLPREKPAQTLQPPPFVHPAHPRLAGHRPHNRSSPLALRGGAAGKAAGGGRGAARKAPKTDRGMKRAGRVSRIALWEAMVCAATGA